MSHHKHHIPYLGFHKAIIREICRPQKDDLLILAKGLGMRRVTCQLYGHLEAYMSDCVRPA